jgi:ATP-dependent DNA helicase RecQ
VASAEQKISRIGDIACDEALFSKLRDLRKRLADERDVPAYIVFSDVSLRQMARSYPLDAATFGRISGVGQKKLDEFGAIFISEIAAHLQTNPKQIFADDSFESPQRPIKRASLNDSASETFRLFRAGRKVEQIAQQRDFAVSTIYGHLAAAIESGEAISADLFFDSAQRKEIADAFAKFGFGNITGVRESFGEKYDYGQLRIYRAIALNTRKSA